MHQRGKTVTSVGQTSSDRGPSALGRQHQLQLHSDCPRFNEWIDPSSDATDTEVSNLVNGTTTTIRNHQKRCCRTSTSSGYSSHSPPLSAGSYSSACCPTSGVLRATVAASGTTAAHHHHHHHHHHSTISRNGAQREAGTSVLAVIHEAETIPRPIWPCMADDLRDIHTSPAPVPRCGMSDCDVTAAHAAAGHDSFRHETLYACCGHCCVCSAYAYRNSCDKTSATSAREVLLELSRTLNSVIDADSDLSAEEILRDISITVARARGIQSSPKDPPSSGICEDYTYRLSSSSSSGGKESVGVNPVNLRVYSKPKWLHVPASSRSSSQCPYEGKTLLTAAQNASRTPPAFGDLPRNDTQRKITDIAPSIFLVPQTNCIFPGSLNSYRSNNFKVAECKDGGNKDVSGRFDESKRNQPIGRLNAGTGKSCDDKCNNGEPVYSTLDGSDESSSYGAIGDSTAKTDWNEGSKVFDRHLDFTLDGNRAERLGRVIAKAKRKRQWCRGLTAIFGLVFFVLSVVVVSLSVTRGRKVFGSM